ncbi:MAG: acyltransferase family protein [Alphaproteobacteria bacterium]
MKYRPEIDGLRGLAVVPVILFHAGFEPFSGGYVGVDVFFVISGYLIASIILDERADGRFTLLGFYERRARRILPALYVVTGVTAAVAAVVLKPSHLISLAQSVISIPVFASNVYFWSERGYFGEAIELKPLVHTWSLAVEEQFYLVFPLLVMGLWRWPRLLVGVLAAGFCLSLFASWYITKLHFETAFYLPMTRAWELAAGVGLAFLSRAGFTGFRGPLAELLSLTGLGLLAYAYLGFDEATPFPYTSALIPVAGSALIIVASPDAAWIRRFLAARPLVLVGLISYSLYLVHQPVFAISRHAGWFDGNEVALIAASFAAAAASYWLVERPFRNRAYLRRRTVFVLALLGGLALAGAGLTLIASDGLIGRYGPQDQRLLRQFTTYADYNQKLFDSLELAPFRDGGRKILLVGDSHAKDFLNVVRERGYFDALSFSTKQIDSDCGPLFLPDDKVIDRFIPDSQKERCAVQGRFEGDRVRELARQADEIWLSGSWERWVVPFLPETVRRLEAEFQATVRVFGRKNFGTVSQEIVLDIPVRERARYTQPAAESARAVNQAMNDALGRRDSYYDVMDIMCGGSAANCRIFDAEGNLISPDGGHLTREGAIEVGRRMRELLDGIVRE